MDDLFNKRKVIEDMSNLNQDIVDRAQDTQLQQSPEQEQSKQDRLAELMDSIREEKKKEAEEAQDREYKRNLIGNIGKFLGTAAAANIQRGAKTDIGIKAPKYSQARDVKSGILKDRDSLLKQLRDEYKMRQEEERYGERRQSEQEKLDWQKSRAERQDDLADKRYEESKAKQELDNQLLQKRLEQYGQITPYQKAVLDRQDLDRELRKELAQTKDKMTPYQQEQVKIAKARLEADKESKKDEKDKKVTKFQEEREKLIAKRHATLKEQVVNTKSNIKDAEYLIKKLKDDELDTGPGSELAGDIGSFFGTEESTDKQLLDSLAEKAARAQLKANGETRPTDADVEGMKRAMFNLGNTEEANIKKLEDFVKRQKALINEYDQMKSKLKKGEGLEDFVLGSNENSKSAQNKRLIKKLMDDNPGISEERAIRALKSKGHL